MKHYCVVALCRRAQHQHAPQLQDKKHFITKQASNSYSRQIVAYADTLPFLLTCSVVIGWVPYILSHMAEQKRRPGWVHVP